MILSVVIIPSKTDHALGCVAEVNLLTIFNWPWLTTHTGTVKGKLFLANFALQIAFAEFAVRVGAKVSLGITSTALFNDAVQADRAGINVALTVKTIRNFALSTLSINNSET